MLRPRAILGVVAVAIVVWVATVHFTAGLDTAATARALGQQLTGFGLPGFGSLVVGRASEAYRSRVRSASPTEAAEARRRLTECEFALAAVFRDRGDARKAIYHYDRAQKASPERAVEAKAWTAYVQAQAGEAGAKRQLLGLLVDAPRDPLPAYLTGRLFLEEGKTAEAQRYLTKSLALPGGTTHRTALALAQASQQAGSAQRAAAYARQALQLGTTETERREAAQVLRQAGGRGPAPLQVWVSTFAWRHRQGLTGIVVVIVVLLWPTWLGLLGRVAPTVAAPVYLLARSSDPAAIRTYEAALRRRPENVRLLRVLARSYGRVGVGATRAASLWERLHALLPGDVEARDQAVRLALEGGRETDEALEACQDWFAANPDHPDGATVASHLARAYRARTTMPPERVLPAVEVAAAAAPADRDLQLFLGTLYSHYGRHTEAAALLGRLLEANPRDEGVRLEYAHALIGAGEAYAAYRHLRTLAPTPDLTADLYLAGIVAHRAGRYRESLRVLQEVMRRDPGLFDVEERLAEASARVVRHRLGGYDVGETLAAHEAVLLHRATHPEHAGVLLLVFRRDFSDALEFPSAFAEWSSELRVRIPGCAVVLDFGADEEEFYVAHEMPPGDPLAHTLAARGPLPPSEAAETIAQVLEALDEVHAAGRLHGDLRLSSVWVDDGGGATLVGAGASQVAEAGPAPTPPGTRSPYHVAPEVVQHRDVSTASDIYAVGCMLYELLVGSPPFEGPTHLATMMAHMTLQPEPPSMRTPSIPVEIDDLVLWALAKDPAGRPASAAEFARQLRAWDQGPEEAEVPTPAEVELRRPLPPEGRPRVEVPGASDVGRWWGLYEATELIATGRFSRVYRGLHRQTGEWHAIKHLQVPRGLHPGEGLGGAPAAQAVQRLFANEMHLLQVLSEEDPPIPRVTTMLQAYRSDDAGPAYAMALMEETLAARVERDGPLAEATAVRTLVPLAETVELLHERGIVHGGISPRSVMFDRGGGVHLGGFDSACRLTERAALLEAQHEAQQAVHAALYILGDVRFLSPERCRGEEFDHATDVYSLGALLFFMLVGAAPFQRPDEMQIMLDHLSTPPPRISEWGIEVTPRTQEVIHRALAKSPSARFESAAAMAAALLGESSALGYRV